MEYISSDTNVWLDFMMIEQLELPFRLPYIYLMNEDAIHDELLSPAGLSENLLALGLVETELEEEDFFCAETYMESYPKLSVYDGVALAMAKCRRITLLTGDGPLRRAAQREGISVMGTIGILDQLYEGVYIGKEEYLECLNRLQKYNGGKIRLPKKELELRIRSALKAV